MDMSSMIKARVETKGLIANPKVVNHLHQWLRR